MNNKKFWTFKNAKNDPKVGELMIYGEISDVSWWGDEVTPKQFKKDLDALGELKELKVFINSPGGDVFAGQAIYSMLNRLPYTVSVYVDGLAASAASIIAMVGDTIRMPKNAMLMIHNPWGMVIGYSSDLRKFADELDKVRESIIPVYKEQTGLEDQEIADLMDAETWMTAEEALEKGFIHEIEEAKPVAALIKDFDLSRFKNVPEQFKKWSKTQSAVSDELLTAIRTTVFETLMSLKAETNEQSPEPEKPPEENQTEPPKPEENPPKNERVFNLQETLAKINQLNERSNKRK